MEKSLSSVSEESLMDTHREWGPAVQLTEDLPEDDGWRSRLGVLIRKQDAEVNQAVL
jgi:hypothetical protein